jgi:hypothetical protein
MFENLPPLHRPTHDADTPRRRALNALGTVLGTLPPPWRMLRDASPSGEGAGLGVRFVAIHPNLGIALVDLAPARPKAALAPLRSLLTRGNGTIFTGREPPIATVLLARDEIPLAAARVEATLAELPPSGIANPAWPEIAIALVTASYPHMMPTDGGRRAIAASGYGSQPNAAQRTPEAPAEAPPPRQETARSAAASTQAAPAAPPAGSRESTERRPAYAKTPSPTPEAPEKAAARFGAGTPPIDVPRIEVPQFDPRRPDHAALEVPPAAIETPVAMGAPEVSSADAAPPSEGEQRSEAPPKPETVETQQLDARQAARRKRTASPRNSRSRRSDPKPSFELPQIEIPQPDLNGGGEAWISRDRSAKGGPRFDLPRIDVPQPPSQQFQEGTETGEAPPPRFDRLPEGHPASEESASGLRGTGAAEPKQPHLRLVAERDPIAPWPGDKRGTARRKRGRPMLWVVGGTLSVIIAAVLAYPHFVGEPVDSTHLTQTSPAPSGPAPGPEQAATASPVAPEAAQQQAESTPAQAAPAPQQAENTPAQAAPGPQSSPSPPTETAEAKPVAPQQSEQSNPAAAPHAATILPPVATLPETLPEKSIAEARHAVPAKPAPQATREAAATPAPAPKPAAEAKAKSAHAPKLAKARRNAPEIAREAEAEIAPKPVPAPRRGVPPKASAPAIASAAIHPRNDNEQQAAPSDNSDSSDAAIVTIGGTSYVAGREPHFLGSLPSPAELASAPASVSASPQADASPAASDSPPAGPLPPSTDFAITPHGIMTPSGVVTPFGKQ